MVRLESKNSVSRRLYSQTYIFERFYRTYKDRSLEVGGTGLGLAIVKHIVEAIGFSVKLVSTLGKGSEFSFYLKK